MTTCATCRHWNGTDTAYRADCAVNAMATAFNDGCGAWEAKNAMPPSSPLDNEAVTVTPLSGKAIAQPGTTKAAGGGTFITNGPKNFIVAEHHKEREIITVTPLVVDAVFPEWRCPTDEEIAEMTAAFDECCRAFAQGMEILESASDLRRELGLDKAFNDAVDMVTAYNDVVDTANDVLRSIADFRRKLYRQDLPHYTMTSFSMSYDTDFDMGHRWMSVRPRPSMDAIVFMAPEEAASHTRRQQPLALSMTTDDTTIECIGYVKSYSLGMGEMYEVSLLIKDDSLMMTCGDGAVITDTPLILIPHIHEDDDSEDSASHDEDGDDNDDLDDWYDWDDDSLEEEDEDI